MMGWLSTPLLLSRLHAVGWVFAAMLLAGVLGTCTGYKVGAGKASAEGAAALSQLRTQHAVERELDALDYATKIRERTLVAFKLADDLQAERDAHAANRTTLEKRIAHVTQAYRPSIGEPAVSLPACVFTAGFVGLYNASIGLPERYAADHPAAGDADSPNATDPAAALDSGLIQADILRHIGAYGQRCLNLESQLNKLLDGLEGINGPG